MFGFSITKLLFTGLIVYVVWKAFNYVTSLSESREERPRMRPGGDAPRGPSGPGPSTGSSTGPATGSGPGAVEDMVECPVCQAYVTQNANSCGRPDCPYTG